MGNSGFVAYIDNTPLRVQFNSEGGGLLLCVDRGIPCEGHTQVFSAHCTNTPEGQDVIAELTEHRDWYKKRWDAFVTLMHSMGKPDMSRITDWSVKEAVAAVFCTYMIRSIAEASEKRWEKRMESREVSNAS